MKLSDKKFAGKTFRVAQSYRLSEAQKAELTTSPLERLAQMIGQLPEQAVEKMVADLKSQGKSDEEILREVGSTGLAGDMNVSAEAMKVLDMADSPAGMASSPSSRMPRGAPGSSMEGSEGVNLVAQVEEIVPEAIPEEAEPDDSRSVSDVVDAIISDAQELKQKLDRGESSMGGMDLEPVDDAGFIPDPMQNKIAASDDAGGYKPNTKIPGLSDSGAARALSDFYRDRYQGAKPVVTEADLSRIKALGGDLAVGAPIEEFKYLSYAQKEQVDKAFDRFLKTEVTPMEKDLMRDTYKSQEESKEPAREPKRLVVRPEVEKDISEEEFPIAPPKSPEQRLEDLVKSMAPTGLFEPERKKVFEPNPNFDPDLPISDSNSPVIESQDSDGLLDQFLTGKDVKRFKPVEDKWFRDDSSQYSTAISPGVLSSQVGEAVNAKKQQLMSRLLKFIKSQNPGKSKAELDRLLKTNEVYKEQLEDIEAQIQEYKKGLLDSFAEQHVKTDPKYRLIEPSNYTWRFPNTPEGRAEALDKAREIATEPALYGNKIELYDVVESVDADGNKIMRPAIYNATDDLSKEVLEDQKFLNSLSKEDREEVEAFRRRRMKNVLPNAAPGRGVGTHRRRLNELVKLHDEKLKGLPKAQALMRDKLSGLLDPESPSDSFVIAKGLIEPSPYTEERFKRFMNTTWSRIFGDIMNVARKERMETVPELTKEWEVSQGIDQRLDPVAKWYSRLPLNKKVIDNVDGRILPFSELTEDQKAKYSVEYEQQLKSDVTPDDSRYVPSSIVNSKSPEYAKMLMDQLEKRLRSMPAKQPDAIDTIINQVSRMNDKQKLEILQSYGIVDPNDKETIEELKSTRDRRNSIISKYKFVVPSQASAVDVSQIKAENDTKYSDTIQQLSGSIESLSEGKASAEAAGDGAKASEIQAKIDSLKSELEQVNSAKDYIDARTDQFNVQSRIETIIRDARAAVEKAERELHDDPSLRSNRDFLDKKRGAENRMRFVTNILSNMQGTGTSKPIREIAKNYGDPVINELLGLVDQAETLKAKMEKAEQPDNRLMNMKLRQLREKLVSKTLPPAGPPDTTELAEAVIDVVSKNPESFPLLSQNIGTKPGQALKSFSDLAAEFPDKLPNLRKYVDLLKLKMADPEGVTAPLPSLTPAEMEFIKRQVAPGGRLSPKYAIPGGLSLLTEMAMAVSPPPEAKLVPAIQPTIYTATPEEIANKKATDPGLSDAQARAEIIKEKKSLDDRSRHKKLLSIWAAIEYNKNLEKARRDNANSLAQMIPTAVGVFSDVVGTVIADISSGKVSDVASLDARVAELYNARKKKNKKEYEDKVSNLRNQINVFKSSGDPRGAKELERMQSELNSILREYDTTAAAELIAKFQKEFGTKLEIDPALSKPGRVGISNRTKAANEIFNRITKNDSLREIQTTMSGGVAEMAGDELVELMQKVDFLREYLPRRMDGGRAGLPPPLSPFMYKDGLVADAVARHGGGRTGTGIDLMPPDISNAIGASSEGFNKNLLVNLTPLKIKLAYNILKNYIDQSRRGIRKGGSMKSANLAIDESIVADAISAVEDISGPMDRDRVAAIIDRLSEDANDLITDDGQRRIARLMSDPKLAKLAAVAIVDYVNSAGETFDDMIKFPRPAVYEAAINKVPELKKIAADMKLPSVSAGQDDAVDLDDPYDKAADDTIDDLARPAHPSFTVDDQYKTGKYMTLELSWDPDDEQFCGMSHAAVEQAIRSFVKGLESKKDYIDLGFLGKVVVDDLDLEAGMATATVATDKAGISPEKVKAN